jgi:hypothetical protein
MSKVITFSRFFPAYHPKKGEPTYFVEKIARGLHQQGVRPFDIPDEIFSTEMYYLIDGKHHTIRAGNRWKVGDKFSPRVWSGKPYNSKQIIIAPDIEIKKVWDVLIMNGPDWFEVMINGKDYLNDGWSLFLLAQNDGLRLDDMMNWFKDDIFAGQIICWNDSINY